ncbi:hypothetical protein [Olivibacter sp. XZL3]|nr:hypothetical protein [Olivibacter sp. XZL3]
MISLMPEATDLIARINNDGSFNEETITKYVHLYNQYSQER